MGRRLTAVVEVIAALVNLPPDQRATLLEHVDEGSADDGSTR
jgi:DNA-directed RNA polymerase specialized sigma24 family protein